MKFRGFVQNFYKYFLGVFFPSFFATGSFFRRIFRFFLLFLFFFSLFFFFCFLSTIFSENLRKKEVKFPGKFTSFSFCIWFSALKPRPLFFLRKIFFKFFFVVEIVLIFFAGRFFFPAVSQFFDRFFGGKRFFLVKTSVVRQNFPAKI